MTIVIVDNGDDVVNTGYEGDYIDTGWGNDSVYSSGGDDYIDVSWGNDYVDAGDGNDSILGSWGQDTIYAGAGNDTIHGGYDPNLIHDGSGSDHIYGSFWGNNTFVLTQNAGDADTIYDVTLYDHAGIYIQDNIDLTDFEHLSSFDDLIITGSGTNFSIDLGNSQTLNITTATTETTASFTADLFTFAGGGTVDPIPQGWTKQHGLDGAGEFQYADTDNDGTLEFYGMYGGQLWQFVSGNGWTRQAFADGADKFQFVDTNNDGDLEFYGLYGGQLWEFDAGNGWSYTYQSGLTDFQYANNDGDANVELFMEYANGDIWEFDPGDSGWSLLYQFQGATIADWQVIDLDNDGTMDYTYAGDGQVQSFEAGQGWTNLPELGLPDNYQMLDMNGDGINEVMGVYAGEVWQYSFG